MELVTKVLRCKLRSWIYTGNTYKSSYSSVLLVFACSKLNAHKTVTFKLHISRRGDKCDTSDFIMKNSTSKSTREPGLPRIKCVRSTRKVRSLSKVGKTMSSVRLHLIHIQLTLADRHGLELSAESFSRGQRLLGDGNLPTPAPGTPGPLVSKVLDLPALRNEGTAAL